MRCGGVVGTRRGRLGGPVFLLVIASVAAEGCSGTASKPRPAGGTAVSIGAVDPDSAITVDGGLASVRSPMGWQRGSRSDDYLVRYTPGTQRSFPAIVVVATDPPDGITAVDEENHKAFVAAVATRLAETFSRGGKSTLLKKPAAVMLGPHHGVAWTAPGTAKVGGLKEPIERSCVAVVFAGRMYTVEARAPKGKLDDEGRAAARGVAAGIGPPQAAEPSAAEPQADQPAAAEPQAVEPAPAGAGG